MSGDGKQTYLLATKNEEQNRKAKALWKNPEEAIANGALVLVTASIPNVDRFPQLDLNHQEMGKMGNLQKAEIFNRLKQMSHDNAGVWWAD